MFIGKNNIYMKVHVYDVKQLDFSSLAVDRNSVVRRQFKTIYIIYSLIISSVLMRVHSFYVLM